MAAPARRLAPLDGAGAATIRQSPMPALTNASCPAPNSPDLSGLSMNRTAKLLGVSTPSVMTWIERFAEVYAQEPEPEGRALVIELDEMWHFLKKRPTSSGSGRLGIVLQGEWLTGNAAVVTPPP